MSARPRRWLMIDTSVSADLRQYSLETIGAAFAIVTWESYNNVPTDETQMARVCGLSPTKWRTRSADILGARSLLKGASQPKVMFRRSPLSPALRQRIFERDGEVCRYCGATEGPFHVDHIMPVSRGGTDAEENLGVACAPCNFAKAAKVGSEWLY